jgi:hypothetical protein
LSDKPLEKTGGTELVSSYDKSLEKLVAGWRADFVVSSYALLMYERTSRCILRIWKTSLVLETGKFLKWASNETKWPADVNLKG